MSAKFDFFFRRLATDADKALRPNIRNMKFWTVNTKTEVLDLDKVVIIEAKAVNEEKYMDLKEHQNDVFKELGLVLAQNASVSYLIASLEGDDWTKGFYNHRKFKDGVVIQEYSGTVLWIAHSDSGISRNRGLNIDGITGGVSIPVQAQVA